MDNKDQTTGSSHNMEATKEIEPHLVLSLKKNDEAFRIKGGKDLIYTVRRLSDGDMLYSLNGELEDPLDTVIEVEAGSVLFLQCDEGSSLFSEGGRKFACVPGMYLAIPGRTKYVTRLGRGKHRRRGFVTNQNNIAGSLKWSKIHAILSDEQFFHGTTSAQVHEITGVSLEEQESENASYKDVIRYYALCSAILGSPKADLKEYSPHVLVEGYQQFADLIKMVDQSHTEDWSLPKAAKICGYSVYHFSRLFRNYMGAGFPEVVTTVRAYKCLNDILETSLPLQRIAEKNGFSAPSILRDALRDLFGFSAAEIRSFKQLDFERMTA